MPEWFIGRIIWVTGVTRQRRQVLFLMLAFLHLGIQLTSLSCVAQNKLRSFTIKMNVCKREWCALCKLHTSLQEVQNTGVFSTALQGLLCRKLTPFTDGKIKKCSCWMLLSRATDRGKCCVSIPGWIFFLAKGSTGYCSERDKKSCTFRAYIIFEMFCVVKTSCYAQKSQGFTCLWLLWRCRYFWENPVGLFSENFWHWHF